MLLRHLRQRGRLLQIIHCPRTNFLQFRCCISRTAFFLPAVLCGMNRHADLVVGVETLPAVFVCGASTNQSMSSRLALQKNSGSYSSGVLGAYIN